MNAPEFDVVVVSPNAALDSYYVLPELAVGDVNRSTKVLHTAGGKGNNMARAVARLGGRVLSLGIIGGSSGEFIASELEREGIAADMVWTMPETRRCTTILVPARKQTTVILENGPGLGDEAKETLTANVLKHATRAPFLTLIGSLPPDFPDDYYAVLLGKVKDVPVRVAVDCTGKALALSVRAGPAVVKVNLKEFQSTFKIPEWEWRMAAEMFSDLSRNGIEALIITDGAEGAYVFSKDLAPCRVFTKIDSWVNTTGAGDTFLAGLLLSLNRNEPLEKAVHFAAAAAAASLQHVGSGFLDMEDVQRYSSGTQIERLDPRSA